MKKNREKANQKRSQKREANNRARRKISRMTKQFVQGLRKQGIHIPMPSGVKDRTTHTSEDVISIPQCTGIGRCCTNMIVNLDPADVWRILNNENVRQRFGVDLTMDLVSTEPDKGIIEYWVDPRIGVPRCKLKHIKKEQGLIECIFLGMEEGKATCILGDDRPTICMGNPIGRVGQHDDKGHLASWGYVIRDEACRKCEYKEEGERQVRVEELLGERKMQERYEMTDLFYGLQGWMANEIKVEEMRKLATMICFDWDRFLIEIGGRSREDVKSVRPDSPLSVLASARQIVDGIMRGQQDVVSIEGSAKAGDDGVEPAREAIPPDHVG
jgi:hypothetical protein